MLLVVIEITLEIVRT